MPAHFAFSPQKKFFSRQTRLRLFVVDKGQPVPRITPRQNQVLLRLQEMLGEQFGRDVFFVSITVDPERDTPEALREYVAGIGARPGWIFLTGKPENVAWVNHRLGQHLESLDDHKGVYMLGNVGTTLWMKVPAHGQPLDLYRKRFDTRFERRDAGTEVIGFVGHRYGARNAGV